MAFREWLNKSLGTFLGEAAAGTRALRQERLRRISKRPLCLGLSRQTGDWFGLQTGDK